MRASPLLIEILDSTDGKVFATITPQEFQGFMCRDRVFLSELIKMFNAGKAAAGEPERVRQVLA